MTFDVILSKQADEYYIARPLFWPDTVAHGATEQEALANVRVLIQNLFNQTQVVQVEVDVPENQTSNPWLAKAGTFANDPTWEEFLKATADHRQQIDSEQTSELV